VACSQPTSLLELYKLEVTDYMEDEPLKGLEHHLYRAVCETALAVTTLLRQHREQAPGTGAAATRTGAGTDGDSRGWRGLGEAAAPSSHQPHRQGTGRRGSASGAGGKKDDEVSEDLREALVALTYLQQIAEHGQLDRVLVDALAERLSGPVHTVETAHPYTQTPLHGTIEMPDATALTLKFESLVLCAPDELVLTTLPPRHGATAAAGDDGAAGAGAVTRMTQMPPKDQMVINSNRLKWSFEPKGYDHYKHDTIQVSARTPPCQCGETCADAPPVRAGDGGRRAGWTTVRRLQNVCL